MKYLPAMVAAMALMAGCASHYQRVQDDRVLMYLERTEAERVSLASSLDGFAPREARKEGGRWVVGLPADRVFRYFYLLDGRPFVPPCRLKERDDFGSENCIFDPRL
ncbi:MAG: hypothetical protein ACOWWM_14540 [Desulfobacterales bacterium]